jgi:hypothetical protein
MNSAVYLKKFADKHGLKIEVHSSLDVMNAVLISNLNPDVWQVCPH